MTGLGYLEMEEVPGIPQLPRTPGAVVYAPLGDTPVAVPGKDLSRVVDELGTIAQANAALADYHRDRRRTLASE